MKRLLAVLLLCLATPAVAQVYGDGHFDDLEVDAIVDFDAHTSCVGLSTDADGTIGCESSLVWSDHSGYPPACSAGTAVTQIGDLNTCSTFVTGPSGSNHDIQINNGGVLGDTDVSLDDATNIMEWPTAAGSARFPSGLASGAIRGLNIKFDSSVPQRYEILSDANDPYPGVVGLQDTPYITMNPSALGDNVELNKTFSATSGGAFSGDVVFNGTMRLAIGTFGAADTTPDVSSRDSFVTGGGSLTITDFDSGVGGQLLIIRSAHSAVTIQDNANLVLANADFVMNSGDTMMLVADATAAVWYEISRSDNSP